MSVRFTPARITPARGFFIPHPMRILLRDMKPAVAAALAKAFADVLEVEVVCGDIFDAGPADAIVSPANSHGWMDGGIDLAYLQHFGDQLERDLRLMIRRDHSGLLPIGQALVIATGAAHIPWMISAPTMEVPMAVPYSQNAYKAFRATLLMARERSFQKVLCPGFCTLTGRMAPDEAARQMRQAWDEVTAA